MCGVGGMHHIPIHPYVHTYISLCVLCGICGNIWGVQGYVCVCVKSLKMCIAVWCVRGFVKM